MCLQEPLSLTLAAGPAPKGEGTGLVQIEIAASAGTDGSLSHWERAGVRGKAWHGLSCESGSLCLDMHHRFDWAGLPCQVRLAPFSLRLKLGFA